jgi:signal transduction histidine kinase/DNA-binding response OmpR family regulator
MKNQKLLPSSNAVLWGIYVFALLLWLAASWFVTDYILATRGNALIQDKAAAIDRQAVNIAKGIASDLNDLHGIPTVVASDGVVLNILSRFGADARPSPLAVEQRKKTWAEDAQLKSIDSHLNLIATSLGADVVYVINAAGDCVAASNAGKQESFVGTNYASREYFLEAMAGKKGYQYAMGKMSNIPGLFFSAPVILDGRIVGVAVAKINLPALLQLVNQADAFITDGNGVIILASDTTFEMRSLPGAAIAGLSKAERIARYKREDFPVLSINPWPGRWGASLHRFDEENQPIILTDRPLQEKETKVHVFRRLPEIVEIDQDKLKQFLLLGISGAVVLLFIGMRIIFLRTRKLAEEALHQTRLDAETAILAKNAELMASCNEIEIQRLRAETASLAKSDFLANMSHEIRTPMNAILGMAEILSETELTPEQRRYVGIFQNAGNNLLDLINDILDMSKVEAGQMELDKADFSLEQSLNDQIDLNAIRAFDKGLELVLDIKPGVPEFVYGDAKRLKQCLTNLVGNAIKFSQEGAIVIGVRPVDDKPDMLQFSVSDTGIGIPAEKHAAIFEPFSQADSSTTRRFGGTGLGLTITRRLVGLMEGDIWVDSKEGEGSTFRFTARLPQATQPVRTDIPVDLRNLKVLVVDDFPINRTIVRQYLQPLGAEVSEAESAKQALALLEEAAVKGVPFALALVDSQMPEMCGIDLCVLIRANHALEGLKIIILSSDDTAKQRHRAKDLALTYLLKPIKRHELILSIGHELQQNTPSAPKAETLPPVPQASQGGLHILLAEDNQDNVLLIRVFLKQTAHRLDVAEDGLVALEKFRANNYDVVLMDVQMPNMGGYEATAEIRRIEQAEGRTPTMIIALTAHALKEDEQRSMDAGCNGHLTKPIKKKVLLEVLQSIKQSKPTE